MKKLIVAAILALPLMSAVKLNTTAAQDPIPDCLPCKKPTPPPAVPQIPAPLQNVQR